MKILKTFASPDFPLPNIKIQKRESVRIVLIDDEGKLPIIHARKRDCYKIAGGGIDPGEDRYEALRREALEEVGCKIEILGEVGMIHEVRVGGEGDERYNLDQTSYCYYGKIIAKHEPQFTDHEIERGFVLHWLTYKEAAQKFENASPHNEPAQIINERDFLFLKEGYKLLRQHSKI